jgi:hypothetical protein
VHPLEAVLGKVEIAIDPIFILLKNDAIPHCAILLTMRVIVVQSRGN